MSGKRYADGVRRRVVVLRDALVRGAPLNLREEAAAGGLEAVVGALTPHPPAAGERQQGCAALRSLAQGGAGAGGNLQLEQVDAGPQLLQILKGMVAELSLIHI